MDFQRSFTYVFEDKDWILKILIGGLLSFIPVVNFAVFGFAIETLKRARNGEEPVLPDWKDFGMLFSEGLLFALGMLVYLLVPLLVSFSGVIPMMGRSNSSFNFGIFGFVSLFVIFYVLAWLFFYPAIFLNYARKGTFSSMFEIGEIFSIFSKNASAYFMCWVNILLAAMVSAVLSAIPGIGRPLSVFAGFYANLVVSGAVAQYWLLTETSS